MNNQHNIVQMFVTFQDRNPHKFFLTYFVIYLIKKNISITVLKEALGVKDDAERAEYDDLGEANISKLDDLFETELETSDKEADNYKCFFSARKCTLIIQN